MKKSSTLVAAAGLALALGAPLVASIPANAAVQPSPTTSSSTVTTGIGAHVFSGGKLEITSSTIHDGAITVTGKIRVREQGHRDRRRRRVPAVGKTDATGAFHLTVAAANVGDYSLQIGKRVTATVFAKSYQAPGSPSRCPDPPEDRDTP